MSSDGSNNDGGDEDQENSFPDPDPLKTFREQWQRELQISPKHSNNSQAKVQVLDNNVIEKKTAKDEEFESVESKANNLFLKGIENEQSGKLYEAIQFYKRAVQLVPDIEFRFYEATKPKLFEKIEQEDSEIDKINHDVEVLELENLSEAENEDEDDSDILMKLSKIVVKNGYVCFPNEEQNTIHISSLPMEIIIYILRWVVSSELDIRSLEMISRVSRGFYVCARDAEIWKMACVRVWGVNCGRFEPEFLSWRDMYMKRPRLRFNGCYISKTTYIRPGENSFQDQFYKPWHLVEYFRYLRFFPEGKVLMLTSTEDAQSCVSSLKNRIPRNTSVLIGHYRLHNNCVTLVLKRQETKSVTTTFSNRRRKRNEPVHDSGEQTFHVEFEIQHYRKRPNSQLSWLCYIIYTKYKNGQEVPTKLSLGGRYSSFRFSRVKSYTQESEFPLQ